MHHSHKRFATARVLAVCAFLIAATARGSFLRSVLPRSGWASFNPSRIVCAKCTTVPIVLISLKLLFY
jgi:hypothetical protein